MDAEMERTLLEYNQVFNKMFALVRKLPNWQDDCECPEVDHTFYCYDAWDTLSEICCECGGKIKE